MLVFTRRRDQTIMIGDGIEIRVLRVGREGVRLGIVAPADVPVHRQEIYDQIREANRSAAAVRQPMPAIAGRHRMRRCKSRTGGVRPAGCWRSSKSPSASSRAERCRGTPPQRGGE
jgi:carbon storage regulator